MPTAELPDAPARWYFSQPAPPPARLIDSRFTEAGMRLWVAAIAAAVLVAGCGTTQARPGSGPVHLAAGGPGGPRAQAEALARHLLLPAPAPGVDAADIDVSMAPLSGTTTLVAAYADAAWLPSRTAAEHLEPASIRAVTISADQLAPKPRHLIRTFTSAAVIARLAAFLNRRPPAPTAALAGLSCPAPLVSFRLQFMATGRQAPAVAVSTAACMADAITVNGRQQTLLWDTKGGLASMVRKLLGQA